MQIFSDYICVLDRESIMNVSIEAEARIDLAYVSFLIR